MNIDEIRAELSIKMLELEKALDNGMPYSKIKKIYSEVKELQYRSALAEVKNNTVAPQSNDLIVE